MFSPELEPQLPETSAQADRDPSVSVALILTFPAHLGVAGYIREGETVKRLVKAAGPVNSRFEQLAKGAFCCL